MLDLEDSQVDESIFEQACFLPHALKTDLSMPDGQLVSILATSSSQDGGQFV